MSEGLLHPQLSFTQNSVKTSPPISEGQGDMANPLLPAFGKAFEKLLGFGEQLELLGVALGGSPKAAWVLVPTYG